MISQQLEDELRTVFTRIGDGLEVSEETRRRLTGHRYHPGRPSSGRIAAAGGAIGLAAAATVFALLPSSGQATPSKATVTLDAFTFKLPAGYVPKPSRACNFIYILPTPFRLGAPVSRHLSPGAEHHYVSAAAAKGGCITLSVSTPYARKPGQPDPNALPGSKPVRVGDHHGFVNGFSAYYAYVRPHKHVPAGYKPTPVHVQILNVQIKAPHGQLRDVTFYTTELRLRAVIKIAVSGLG